MAESELQVVHRELSTQHSKGNLLLEELESLLQDSRKFSRWVGAVLRSGEAAAAS